MLEAWRLLEEEGNVNIITKLAALSLQIFNLEGYLSKGEEAAIGIEVERTRLEWVLKKDGLIRLKKCTPILKTRTCNAEPGPRRGIAHIKLENESINQISSAALILAF